MTLAEIIAEGERQITNYQTMILPHGDARRLLAVAKAAVEMRSLMPYGYDHIPGKTSEWDQALAALDAAAVPR